jgi:hypothetical protein
MDKDLIPANGMRSLLFVASRRNFTAEAQRLRRGNAEFFEITEEMEIEISQRILRHLCASAVNSSIT